jgi:3-deoxy-D-arabino-heptulosonate 7-phosphate (DAHP) synthase
MEFPMTKPATPTTPFTPFKFPKLDIDALFAAQKANLAVFQEAQNVLIDAAQAIAKTQYDWTMDMVANGENALRGKQAKPETFVADMQSTAERTVAVAKQSVDLAAAAQQRVAELVAQRAAANLDELKSLAA